MNNMLLGRPLQRHDVVLHQVKKYHRISGTLSINSSIACLDRQQKLACFQGLRCCILTLYY